MTLETFIEAVGVVLVATAMLRASMAAFVTAGHRMTASLRERRDLKNFREQAAELKNARNVSRSTLLGREGQKSFDPTPRRARNPQLRQFRIVRKVYENLKGDVCSFYLAPVDGNPIPSYRPGQYLTFELSIPGEHQILTRCYSLSQSPTHPQVTYRVTIKRQRAPANAPPGAPDGLSSNFFHDNVHEGSIVEAHPPAGDFCLDHLSERPVVLVAGGVGATPLASMLNYLTAMQSRREIWFFYGVRDRSEHAFYDQLNDIRTHIANVRIVVFYEHPTALCRKGSDYDAQGHISVDAIQRMLQTKACEFYVCGPPVMMQSVTTGLRKWGIADADIKTESFGSPATTTTTQQASCSIADRASTFQVKFSKSKKTVVWSARNGSLLELAEACGVRARCACRAGQCGTCKIAISSGEVDYAKEPQAALENGFCLPCVARPKSDLVLEL